MQDYDQVVLTERLDEDLPAGTRGTIMMTFTSDTTGQPEAYVIEFFDDDGDTIGIDEALDSQVVPFST